MINFRLLDERHTLEALGLIPNFLSEDDSRSAREQFHERYAHGGGWMPMSGWSMGPVGEIMYPDDPPYHPIAVAELHGNELIYVYPHAWVAIRQIDGTFEISRMD